MTVQQDARFHGRTFIFHSPDEAAMVWHRPHEDLSGLCDFLERKLSAFADPAAEAFHLHHLMPIPSYEFAWALPLSDAAPYFFPFELSEECGVSLRLQPGTRATVTLDGVAVLLERESGAVRASCGGEAIPIASETIHLTSRTWRGDQHVGANGGSLAIMPAGPAAGVGRRDGIEVAAGTVMLLQAQTLAGAGRFLWFPNDPTGAAGLIEFREERNPFRFDWGLRSYGMLNMVLAFAIARDLVAAPGDADLGDRDDLRARLTALVSDPSLPSFLLDRLLKWPLWRPGVGRYPEEGVWDRNSFTNGTLPALVATLARITGREREPAVLEAFHDRGTAFLGTIARAASLPLAARDRKFWLRRSANHGVVMFTSLLLGARLLGEERHPDLAAAETMLGELLHDLHQDGSFCEGIAYDFFAQGFFLPYRALARDHAFRPGLNMGSLDALLGDTFDWMSLAHDREGQVFANFGDNFTQRVRRTSYLAFAQSKSGSKLEAPAGYRDEPDELFSLAPPLDLTVAPAAGITSRLFETNRSFLATEHEDDGRRRQGLFVIGSRLQRTHNHHHDCGGFAYYYREAAIVIPSSRRESHLNNAVGLERDGCVIEHPDRRSYSGVVRRLAGSANETRVETYVKFDESFSRGGDGRWLARRFTLSSAGNLPLVVSTRIKVREGVRPFLGLALRGIGSTPINGACWLRTFGRAGGGAWRPIEPTVDDGLTRFMASTDSDDDVFEFLTCVATGALALDPEAIAGDIARAERLD